MKRMRRIAQLGIAVAGALLTSGCVSVGEHPAPSSESLPKRALPSSVQGYVVYVGPHRVVVDLAAQDGLKPGTLLSLRRDNIRIVHPITGKLLGELDEEVAIAKVIDVRDLFSVAEVQFPFPGHQIMVKDRVILLERSKAAKGRLPVLIP